MAKTNGLGEVINVADSAGTPRAITNDVTNWAETTPMGTQDVTGVDKSAHEMLLLLADFTVTLNGVFNNAANLSHAVFASISSTRVVRSVEMAPTGNTTGNPKLLINCILTDYQVTRSNTGELTWQVPGQLADGATPTWTTY